MINDQLWVWPKTGLALFVGGKFKRLKVNLDNFETP